MNKTITAISAVIFLAFTSVMAIAQDNGGSSSSSTTTTTTTSSSGVDASWFSDHWMWIAGAVVVLIILIAALSGRSRSTTVERTTVIRDNNV